MPTISEVLEAGDRLLWTSGLVEAIGPWGAVRWYAGEDADGRLLPVSFASVCTEAKKVLGRGLTPAEKTYLAISIGEGPIEIEGKSHTWLAQLLVYTRQWGVCEEFDPGQVDRNLTWG